MKMDIISTFQPIEDVLINYQHAQNSLVNMNNSGRVQNFCHFENHGGRLFCSNDNFSKIQSLYEIIGKKWKNYLTITGS